jgi:hypothetical protein
MLTAVQSLRLAGSERGVRGPGAVVEVTGRMPVPPWDGAG